jgi:hypothetical protein
VKSGNNNGYNSENSLEFFDIAAIPDYKTSVMMNRLFRKIKENENLDALEESDDDDEFENMNDDKFVNLDRCVKMECMYNKKFDKYVPLKVAIQGNIISRQILDSKKSVPVTKSMNVTNLSKTNNYSNPIRKNFQRY